MTLRRTGFARPTYQPAPAAPLRALEVAPNYGGGTSFRPDPKAPALRNQHLREMASGEECTVQLGGACKCSPETTVWAHTNRLADSKGVGYKSSDERGFFAGYQCHRKIDQGGMSAAEVDAVVARAQERTRLRLHEIASSYSIPPWKQKAAQWALDRLEGK